MEKKRKRQIRNINSVLPPDLIDKIFSKLEFLNLFSCRFVCKAWNNLVLSCKFDPPISISNLSFAHFPPYGDLHFVDFDLKHLEGMSSVASLSFHPDFSSRRISIFNSCCGLLCLFIRKRRSRRPDVCILNPITNEYFKLPPTSKAEKGIDYFYGLGFSPKTKQFKLARNSFISDKASTLVEIFGFGTSRSNKWTPVGFVPCSFGEDVVYFNGGLYWVGDQLQLNDTNVIYRLDIENEKIQEISSPQDGGDSCFIGVFNGILYLTLSLVEDEFHVWKMDLDHSSWIKAFVVSTRPEDLPHINHRNHRIDSYHLQLIKACEDGKILCLYAGLDLLLYDPKSQTAELLTDQDVQRKKHMCVHQIDSFNFNSLHEILAGNG